MPEPVDTESDKELKTRFAELEYQQIVILENSKKFLSTTQDKIDSIKVEHENNGGLIRRIRKWWKGEKR